MCDLTPEQASTLSERATLAEVVAAQACCPRTRPTAEDDSPRKKRAARCWTSSICRETSAICAAARSAVSSPVPGARRGRGLNDELPTRAVGRPRARLEQVEASCQSR
ncbi:MAG: hypothetical protein MZW92_38390 [Comamonadaceae bacterium]|nr:hypothetical protein [Comamonadaceae bacterium]